MKNTAAKIMTSLLISATFLSAAYIPAHADILDDVYMSDYTYERRVSLNIEEGDTANVYPYLSFEGRMYEWKIDNKHVASTDRDTVIYANNPGYTQIAAISYDETVVFDITVTESSYVKKAAYNKSKDITLYAGDKKNLAQYVAGNADDYKWESRRKSVATVTSYGVVRGVKAGTAEIKAYSDYNGYNYTFYVSVNSNESATPAKVSKASSSIKNNYESIDIYLNPDDSVDISGYLAKDPARYEWSVSDKSVCRVSDGIITAKSTGTTTIKANGSTNYRFNVKVNKNYNAVELSIKAGNSIDIESYLDERISRYDITSYDKSVARLYNGEITAISKGTTNILCENSNTNEKVQFTITVR